MPLEPRKRRLLLQLAAELEWKAGHIREAVAAGRDPDDDLSDEFQRAREAYYTALEKEHARLDERIER